jgi:hypothetical protein
MPAGSNHTVASNRLVFPDSTGNECCDVIEINYMISNKLFIILFMIYNSNDKTLVGLLYTKN